METFRLNTADGTSTVVAARVPCKGEALAVDPEGPTYVVGDVEWQPRQRLRDEHDDVLELEALVMVTR